MKNKSNQSSNTLNQIQHLQLNIINGNVNKSVVKLNNELYYFISYFCINNYDILGNLYILYEHLMDNGLIIINIIDKLTQIDIINYFCNQYCNGKVKIIFECHKNDNEFIVIVQKLPLSL